MLIFFQEMMKIYAKECQFFFVYRILKFILKVRGSDLSTFLCEEKLLRKSFWFTVQTFHHAKSTKKENHKSLNFFFQSVNRWVQKEGQQQQQQQLHPVN
jgi:hypothetical protein